MMFCSIPALADDPYRTTAGAGEAGSGYACIMKTGFWSAFHNQVSLAENKSTLFGINYENRFNIKELGTRSAGLVIPAGRTSIGAIYSHFGYPDFSRQMAGLACGLPISEKIDAGIQIDYFSERTAGEYNNRQSITCEAGLLISPSENLRLGIHLFNPLPNSLRKSYLPSAISAGAGIFLSKSLFAGAELEMASGDNLIFRTGFDYEAAKKVRLRGGFCTKNTSFSFGLGYLFNQMQIDLAFVTHDKLGVTSSASLIFNLTKK